MNKDKNWLSKKADTTTSFFVTPQKNRGIDPLWISWQTKTKKFWMFFFPYRDSCEHIIADLICIMLRAAL